MSHTAYVTLTITHNVYFVKRKSSYLYPFRPFPLRTPRAILSLLGGGNVLNAVGAAIEFLRRPEQCVAKMRGASQLQ